MKIILELFVENFEDIMLVIMSVIPHKLKEERNRLMSKIYTYEPNNYDL